MPPPAHQAPRHPAIDLLRGLVMVVMLLDHTRDFVHVDGLTGDPTDLRTTTPALFLTRWITHYCAPVFVFLAGLSIRIQLLRGADRRELGLRTMRRGCHFLLLELVVLRPLMWFQFDYSFLAHLQVIWAIGWGMVVLGALLRTRVPPAAIAAAGLLVVAGHNLLTHVPFAFTDVRAWETLRILLFGRGGIQFGADGPVAIGQYAIVPWVGVLLVGFGLGRLYGLEATARRRALLGLGLTACTLFVLLRATGGYGDPSPWTNEPTTWRSVLSFLRVEKYPPSLQYLLMTLGPGLLVLAACERVRADGPWSVVVRLGRAPLFFYVLQWATVHLVSRLLQWLDGQPIGWDAPNPLLQQPLPPGCGFSLGVVYLAWAIGLAGLVPLTLWWERQRRPAAR
ncbi:MAG: DUF1624 domain-containing protein [Planctomycetes bacterium]|nr:DUF1624 domain-containing protein [Planctomycetota bacterium]